MTRMDCEEFRDLAPELALGVLDGADRARTLAHVAGCASCRRYVDELSRTADALLLAGPEAEPPRNFESATVALLRPRTPVRRWRVLAVAAALVAIAGSVGGIVGRQSVGEGRDDLRTAAIVAADGRDIGEVSLRDGPVSWCFVQVDAPNLEGDYDVHARLRDGRTVLIQRFAVTDGRGSYGRVMEVRARDVVEIRLSSPGTEWRASADLSQA